MPLHSSTAGGWGEDTGKGQGCGGEPPPHPPGRGHSLLPSSFTRDTSKLFLRGFSGLMSTARSATASRRASLTAAALRPNTRQLLLGAGEKDGGGGGH